MRRLKRVDYERANNALEGKTTAKYAAEWRQWIRYVTQSQVRLERHRIVGTFRVVENYTTRSLLVTEVQDAQAGVFRELSMDLEEDPSILDLPWVSDFARMAMEASTNDQTEDRFRRALLSASARTSELYNQTISNTTTKENTVYSIITVQLIDGTAAQIHANIPGKGNTIVWQSEPCQTVLNDDGKPVKDASTVAYELATAKLSGVVAAQFAATEDPKPADTKRGKRS